LSQTNPALISIILPTYNGATYLANAIESVLRQTYSRWELIIVDSYSTDETPHIVARYTQQDARIRAIQHPKDAGRLPGALNAGFTFAKGVYHTWLQDDNEFMPEALAHMVAYLETHPEIGLVYTHIRVMHEDDNTSEIWKRLPPEHLATKNILTPSFLYRAAVYVAIGGYRTDYFTAEDYDFWIRARDVARFHLMDEVLHMHRFQPRNLTAQYAGTYQDEVVERLLLDNLTHQRWLQQAEHRARAYYQLGELARKHGRMSDARHYWGLSFRTYPVIALRRLILRLFPEFMQRGLARLWRSTQGLIGRR
jgi:glycosyltransferase involved in cell wall biosynthesis